MSLGHDSQITLHLQYATFSCLQYFLLEIGDDTVSPSFLYPFASSTKIHAIDTHTLHLVVLLIHLGSSLNSLN